MFLLFVLLLAPLQLVSDQVSNVLIYTDPVQVTSSINVYETIQAGQPIIGSIMITHDAGAKIDPNSFRMGEKPIQATFVETTPMSAYSTLQVTIYRFQLEGLPQGTYTLQPIRVRVGGKDYQALPLTVQVAG